MGAPFDTWLGNQRNIAIPSTPQLCEDGTANAAVTTSLTAIVLSAANLANAAIIAYIHYLFLWSGSTAAASGANLQLQWQFRNAAHANVGAAIPTNVKLTCTSGAGLGTIINNPFFNPRTPHWDRIAIPGGVGAAEVCLQTVVTIGGAPDVRFAVGWGVDPTNIGTPSDIGGGGIVAQGANNPNAF